MPEPQFNCLAQSFGRRFFAASFFKLWSQTAEFDRDGGIR